MFICFIGTYLAENKRNCCQNEVIEALNKKELISKVKKERSFKNEVKALKRLIYDKKYIFNFDNIKILTQEKITVLLTTCESEHKTK